jgi:hypothetical protein
LKHERAIVQYCRGQEEPLIHAAFGSLINADQRAEGSVDQRFLLPGKVAQAWTEPLSMSGIA